MPPLPVDSETPLVFNHVPKTAGTALIAALTAAVEPRQPLHGYDRCALGDFTEVDRLSPSARRGLLRRPEDIGPEVDAVFGHIAPSTTRARFGRPNDLTVLREPRVRLVSHWLFSRAHTDGMLRGWAEWGECVRRARLPLVSYLADPLVAFCTDNLVTRFLTWPHPLLAPDTFIAPSAEAELLDVALERLGAFGFVGLAEAPDLVGGLGAWLGRGVVMQRLNESPPMPRGLRCDVATECDRADELVAERTRLDAVLWDAVALRGLVRSPADAAAERERVYRTGVARYGTMHGRGNRRQTTHHVHRVVRAVRTRRRAPFVGSR